MKTSFLSPVTRWPEPLYLHQGLTFLLLCVFTPALLRVRSGVDRREFGSRSCWWPVMAVRSASYCSWTRLPESVRRPAYPEPGQQAWWAPVWGTTWPEPSWLPNTPPPRPLSPTPVRRRGRSAAWCPDPEKTKQPTSSPRITHLVELVLRRDPQVGVDGPFEGLDYPVGIHVCFVPPILLCDITYMPR